jgi:hypothetical protein
MAETTKDKRQREADGEIETKNNNKNVNKIILIIQKFQLNHYILFK